MNPGRCLCQFVLQAKQDLQATMRPIFVLVVAVAVVSMPCRECDQFSVDRSAIPSCRCLTSHKVYLQSLQVHEKCAFLCPYWSACRMCLMVTMPGVCIPACVWVYWRMYLCVCLWLCVCDECMCIMQVCVLRMRVRTCARIQVDNH